MNHSIAFFIAQAINEEQTKQASGLGGTLAGLLARGQGAASGLMGKAAPMLNKGFGALGSATFKHAPEGGMASKLLMGPAGAPMIENGGNSLLNAPELGKTVAKRVGIGAGAGLGGTLALEAPGKMQNNVAYEQQQQHPLRAWLAQHLAGAPKLQHKSYLSPLSL